MDAPDDDGSLTRLEEAFAEAMALDPGQRDEYLSDLARRDPAQAQALGELIVLGDAPDTRWQTGAGAVALQESGSTVPALPFQPQEPTPSLGPGMRVGPFLLGEQIGEGGMATVYRARRDTEDFHQEVAIKVLKRVVHSAEGVARFERERRIVAGLDHPNIAGLIDGGLTEDGRPYFALELVHGEPIDRYCDRHRLSVRQRVRLVVDIARALQVAHQNLIVHRDLKPSNVLVDDQGRVRLLDFGIAKEIQPDDGAAVTRLGTRAMTPVYASPEQLEGTTVTTASDQYQLGLLLFELLTGQCHHTLDGHDPLHIQRRARTLPTPRPSRLLASRERFATRSGEIDRERIARQRDVSSHQLIRQLQNDLDWIILKSLEKGPPDRYPSLAALADDLERFLDGRPISARPPSRTYTLRKWVARHRSQTALALLALLALVVGSSIATWQAVRATRAQHLATAEAETAQQVSSFLIELFDVSDPENAQGDELSSRQLLERGRRRIETELADRPLIQARMMAKIALIHRKLGMYQEALPLAQQALEQLRSELGAASSETLEAQRQVALTYADSGDDVLAEPLLRQMIETLAEGDEDPVLIRARLDLAALLHRRADLEAAEDLYRRVLEQIDGPSPANDPDLPAALAGMAAVRFTHGELSEAEALRRRVLAIYERRFGNSHPDLAKALSELADTLGWQGRDQEAAPLHARAVEVLEKVYGPEHRTVAAGLNRLGTLYGRMGDLEAAKEAFERSTAIKESIFGPGHAETVTGYLNLGRVHALNGEMEGARQRFQLALDSAGRNLGADHPLRGFAFSELARQQRDTGDLDGAAENYRHALGILEPAFGPDHPRLAETLDGMAFVAAEHGRLDKAESLYRRALTIQEVAYGAGKPPLAGPLDGLGAVLRRQGRLEEAKEAHRQAHDAWSDAYGADHPAAGISLARLAHVYLDEGDLEGAHERFENALAIAVKAHGETHLETVAPLEGLAAVARRQGQAERAHDLLLRATEIRAATYGEDHPTVIAQRGELKRLVARGVGQW